MRMLLFIVAAALSSLTAAADLSMPGDHAEAETRRASEPAAVFAFAPPQHHAEAASNTPAKTDELPAHSSRPWLPPRQTWR